MTVNIVFNALTFDGNNVTTDWLFPFPGVRPEYIVCTFTDADGTVTELPPAAYEVTLNPPVDPNPTSIGGKVKFPLSGPPMTNSQKLTVERRLPPNQLVSLSNQGIMYPKVIEQEFDYLTMLDQDESFNNDRSFRVGPQDDPPAILPPAAARANRAAVFDAAGNLTPGAGAPITAFVSPVMEPVVGAATLDLARYLMGVSLPTVVNTTGVTITQVYNRQIVNLTGNAFYNVNVGDPTGFDATFWVVLFNNDNRGKTINVFGTASFILWPGQFVWIFQSGATPPVWMRTRPGRWKPDTVPQFFVDPLLGVDTNDGLSTGGQALKTIQKAIDIVSFQVDNPEAVINLSNGTYNLTQGIVVNPSSPVGIIIIGNVSSPQNVVITASTSMALMTAIDNGVLYLSGVTLSFANATVAGNCAVSTQGGQLIIDRVNFGNAHSGIHMLAHINGVVTVIGEVHTITGVDFAYHLQAFSGGAISYYPPAVTLEGPVTSNGGWAVLQAGSIWCGASIPFTGLANYPGIQYTSLLNGVLFLSGTVFPGTPGTTGSGGQAVA